MPWQSSVPSTPCDALRRLSRCCCMGSPSLQEVTVSRSAPLWPCLSWEVPPQVSLPLLKAALMVFRNPPDPSFSLRNYLFFWGTVKPGVLMLWSYGLAVAACGLSVSCPVDTGRLGLWGSTPLTATFLVALNSQVERTTCSEEKQGQGRVGLWAERARPVTPKGKMDLNG